MKNFREILRTVAVASTAALCVAPWIAAADEAPGRVAAVELGPQTPLAAGIAEGLAADGALADGATAFYSARWYAPLWIGADGRASARADALMAALWTADSHALPRARYDVAELADALTRPGTPTRADAARTELALTRAYLRYARDVSTGLLEPRKVDRNLHVYPERPEAAALLEAMASASDPVAYLAGLAPQDPHYARLKARLASLRGTAVAGAWGGAVPAGPSLRPGARSDRVVSVRNRLIALGDLSAADRTSVLEADQTEIAANAVVTDLPVHGSVGDPRRYDDAVVAAVSRFQERHGLNQDGIVGPKTRGALNADAAFRMRQIAVNLERLRWLNRDLGQRHVFVNLAAYEMALVEDGRPVFESRVVIGKARRHQTPEFSDEMEYMVVNPSWHVPASIAREEILPKLQQDPSYLSRRNMRLVGAGAPAEYIDWWGVTPSTFPGRITQGPGPGNALGKVKFMFPNRWAIYLHDTPHKSLFRRDERAYSHGCVRVHEPFEFAYHLLAPQSADPQAKFQRYLRSGRETWVHFDTHIPVHLTYRTAWVDEDGRDHFRADIYGRDAKVAAALEKAGVDLGL